METNFESPGFAPRQDRTRRHAPHLRAEGLRSRSGTAGESDARLNRLAAWDESSLFSAAAVYVERNFTKLRGVASWA